MTITPTKFYGFTAYLATKLVNLASDQFKMVLTNTAPNVSTTVKYSDIANEITTAGGYSTGGLSITTASAASASGVYTVKLTDLAFTALVTPADAWRYAILIDDTPTDKPCVQWYDYGSSLTLVVGESITFDFDGSLGAYVLAY